MDIPLGQMVAEVFSGPKNASWVTPGRKVLEGMRASRLVKQLLKVSRGPRTRLLESFPRVRRLGGSGVVQLPLGVLRMGQMSLRGLGGWLAGLRNGQEVVQTTVEEENNILSLQEHAEKDLDIQEILERCCLPLSGFGFVRVRKQVGLDGSLTLIAHSQGADESGILPWCEEKLCMAEIGRQLGMLGLVAVSEVNPKKAAHLYVADTALVDDYGGIMDSRIPLRGVAHLIKANNSQAKAELEMWQKDHLLCRLCMTYSIMSSWEEVLPTNQCP